MMKNIKYFPIYVKKDKKKRIKDFIISIFNREDPYWGSKDTFYCMTTYFDKKCTNIQCNGRRRSFEDIYRIVRTYYPSVTKKRLHIILKELKEKSNLKFFYCKDINNVVFCFYGKVNGGLIRDCRSLKKKGFYSINEILEIWKNL